MQAVNANTGQLHLPNVGIRFKHLVIILPSVFPKYSCVCKFFECFFNLLIIGLSLIRFV